MRLIVGIKTANGTRTFLLTGHKIDKVQLDVKLTRHSKKDLDELPQYLINSMPNIFCVEEIENEFFSFEK